MKEKVIDFGNERVSVLFKKLFFPTLLGMLSMSAVTTIDGIFVGHGVGSDGIAAVNICVPLLMSLMGVGLMMGAGCSVIASIYLSKGKTVLARATITQAMLFVTLISVTVGGFILAFPEEWRLLNSDHLRKWEFSEIKKITGMDDAELGSAIGWLAREDKVQFELEHHNSKDEKAYLYLMLNVYI